MEKCQREGTNQEDHIGSQMGLLCGPALQRHPCDLLCNSEDLLHVHTVGPRRQQILKAGPRTQQVLTAEPKPSRIFTTGPQNDTVGH